MAARRKGVMIAVFRGSADPVIASSVGHIDRNLGGPNCLDSELTFRDPSVHVSLRAVKSRHGGDIRKEGLFVAPPLMFESLLNGRLAENGFPVRFMRTCRVKNEIGRSNQRCIRVFEPLTPVLDYRIVKTFSLLCGSCGNEAFELSAFDAKPCAIEGVPCRVPGGGRCYRDADLPFGKRAIFRSFVHGALRVPVEKVLVAGKHCMDKFDKFSGNSGNGNIVAPLFVNTGIEGVDRPRSLSEVFGSLYGKPTCLGRSLFGNTSVAGHVAGLFGGRNKNQLGRKLSFVRKTPDITDSREKS